MDGDGDEGDGPFPPHSFLYAGSSAAAAEEETSSPERGGVSPFPSFLLSLSLPLFSWTVLCHPFSRLEGEERGGRGGGGTHSGSPKKSVSFLHLALGLFWRRRRRPRSEGGQGGFWAVSFPLIYSTLFFFCIQTHSARGVRGKRTGIPLRPLRGTFEWP